MAFLTHAQEHQVEARMLAFLDPKVCAQILLIFQCCFFGVRGFATDAGNLRGRDGRFAKLKFVGHGDFALVVVGRRVALVAEVNLYALPRKLVA